jgi:hypothetical protein
MKSWLLLLLPFGSVIYAGIWLRRRWLAYERLRVDQLITPPRQTFEKLPTQLVEEVRAAAARRRETAEARRRESAQIASGQLVEARIKLMVRR